MPSNRHAAVELDWADGTFTFRLGLSELEELERKLDKSVFALASELGSRLSRSYEIKEVIRIGLIGGGMPPVDALAKVRIYLDERPLDDNRDAAYAVVLAALMRLKPEEIEPSKKAKASKKKNDQKDSTLAQSTATQH